MAETVKKPTVDAPAPAPQDMPDPEADAKRKRAVSRAAYRLRTAGNEQEREIAREEIRELGEEPGDFVLQLINGSTHRVEVPATHHNGLRVVATFEDVQ